MNPAYALDVDVDLNVNFIGLFHKTCLELNPVLIRLRKKSSFHQTIINLCIHYI